MLGVAVIDENGEMIIQGEKDIVSDDTNEKQ